MGVGQKLQDERLRQGLSLEEIEEETKIRKYYLESFGTGKLRCVTSQVYATGLLEKR